MDLLLKRPRRKKLVFLLFSLLFWRVRGEINEFLPHPPKKKEEGRAKSKAGQSKRRFCRIFGQEKRGEGGKTKEAVII